MSTLFQPSADPNEMLIAVLVSAEEDKKKQLSEAEQALRKSEMARKRRNQTEKKLEDDKTEVGGHPLVQHRADY